MLNADAQFQILIVQYEDCVQGQREMNNITRFNIKCVMRIRATIKPIRE